MAAAQVTTIDREQLDRRIEDLNRMMRTHAGAIELVDVTDAGRVTVRFLAMCQGCPFRAVTTLGLIVPALQEIPGVTDVKAQGVGISDEAADRAISLLGEASAWESLSLSKEGL